MNDWMNEWMNDFPWKSMGSREESKASDKNLAWFGKQETERKINFLWEINKGKPSLIKSRMRKTEASSYLKSKVANIPTIHYGIGQTLLWEAMLVWFICHFWKWCPGHWSKPNLSKEALGYTYLKSSQYTLPKNWRLLFKGPAQSEAPEGQLIKLIKMNLIWIVVPGSH